MHMHTMHQQQQLMLLQQQQQKQHFFNACEQLDEQWPARRINAMDLYRTLSGDKGLVPAHSVLALSVERISQMLH